QHAQAVTAVAFAAPDGARLATGTTDGEVRIWDAATGQSVALPARSAAPVRVIVFGPDGRHLLPAAGTAARLWAAATGPPPSPPLSHHQDLTDATFSPDGRLVATASLDD